MLRLILIPLAGSVYRIVQDSYEGDLCFAFRRS